MACVSTHELGKRAETEPSVSVSPRDGFSPIRFQGQYSGREDASNDTGPFEMEKKAFLNMKKLHNYTKKCFRKSCSI